MGDLVFPLKDAAPQIAFLIQAGFATGFAVPVLATGSTAEGGVSPVRARPGGLFLNSLFRRIDWPKCGIGRGDFS